MFSKIKWLVFFLCSYCYSYSQYTATIYISSNNSYGAEFRKDKNKNVFGVGITTFFNKEAKGLDYSNFYSPPLAYEMITAFNGTIYIIYAKKFTDLIVGTRIGLAAKKHFYNGINSNREEWYVIKDAGTYLLYGVMLSTSLDNFQFSFILDNINGISIGVGIKFNEYIK
jgi:hypothetical protein